MSQNGETRVDNILYFPLLRPILFMCMWTCTEMTNAYRLKKWNQSLKFPIEIRQESFNFGIKLLFNKFLKFHKNLKNLIFLF